MNSSISTWAPASPKMFSSSIAVIAASASGSVMATTTPLPAARPEAFTTTGAPNSRAAARAVSTVVCIDARAVGTPASRISALANALDVSICAAAAVGPNTGIPCAMQASASPAASGASGPTITASTCSSCASRTRPATSDADVDTQVASAAMPGLPGAASSVASGISCLMRHARACSRPPPPTSRSFMARNLPWRATSPADRQPPAFRRNASAARANESPTLPKVSFAC